jgi:hypothetical protein
MILFSQSASQAQRCCCNCGPRGPSYYLSWWQMMSPTWCLFFRHAECKICGFLEGSTQISKESLRSHVTCSKQSQSPCRKPMRGWYVKLLEQSQRCSGDSRKLENPGTWNICQV